MPRVSIRAAVALVLAFLLAGAAQAAIVEVPDPGSQYWDSSAFAVAFRVRNGVVPGDQNNVLGTYAVGLGYTDLSTFYPTIPQLLKIAELPAQNPLWSFNTPYRFTLEYVNPNQTNDTLLTIYDPNNNQIVYFGTYLGEGVIYTIRLNYAGGGNVFAANGAVKIYELTLNNIPMGTGHYDSGLTDNYVYFRNSDGTPFTSNFTIAGYFEFTGRYDANTPRFEVDLSTRPVPLPPSVLLLGSGLLGLAVYRRRKPSKG